MRTILAVIFCIIGSSAMAQEPGSAFRDCPDCPEMVVVPAGQFTMGVPASEEERERLPADFRGRATPQTQVSIAAFAIGRTDVTRAQYAAFWRATQHDLRGGCITFGIYRNPPWQREPSATFNSAGVDQTDDHPVICVSWDDAQAYARWLSQRTGQAYRLPSESEWEYAARAGTTTARPWGDDPAQACRYANVLDRSAAVAFRMPVTEPDFHQCEDGNAYTSPVASLQPNAFGLYDMLGNVGQWIEDCWNPTYAARPTDQSAWRSGDCTHHPLRGGSWSDPPRDVRTGMRFELLANARAAGYGFRVARALTP
jgi:formylglycine-generating enzyme required for sulfatase activity